MRLKLILLLCQIFNISNTLNVLVWTTTIGRSHVAFMGGLADIISEGNHNVTMILLKNDPDVNITGTKLVKNIIKFESSLIETNEWSYFNFKQSDIFYTKTIDMGDFFKMQSVNSRICQSLLEDHHLLDRLKNSKFDLAVVEFFHFCPAGIFKMIGIKKVILATALGMTHAHYELLNLQVPLSYVPVQMTHLGSKMSFFGRLYNVLFYYASKFCYHFLLWQDQKIFRDKVDSNFDDLEKLYRNQIEYVFTNTNEFTESTRPTLQMVKYVGTVTTEKPKKLDMDFERILSQENIQGTILFSLGSLLNSDEMPSFIKNSFLEGFKQFPQYNFIWKSKKSNNCSCSNIYYRDWVPQIDLLADPRLKVFITHSGMNSVQESLLFGVPLITLPIFADQDSNAIIAQERGYAYGLNKFSITKHDVIQAIQSVIGEDGKESEFTKKAKKASRILKGNQKNIRKEIQRIVQLEGSTSKLSHLQINVEHLNFVQFYNIDVYIFILISIISFFKILVVIFSTNSNYYLKVEIKKLKYQ